MVYGVCEEGVGIDLAVEGRLVEAVQYKTRSRIRGSMMTEGGSARSPRLCYISFVHICSRRSRVSGSGRVYRAVDTCILGIVNELKEIVQSREKGGGLSVDVWRSEK